MINNYRKIIDRLRSLVQISSLLSWKKKMCCFFLLASFLTLRFICRYTTISFDPAEIRRLRPKEFHTLFMRNRALLYANFLNYSRRCDCAIFSPSSWNSSLETFSTNRDLNVIAQSSYFLPVVLTMLNRQDALLYNTFGSNFTFVYILSS